MEIVSLKLEKSMLNKVDEAIKRHDYGTRTEFIRSALREKLDEMNRDELIEEFMRFRGKNKKNTSDTELRKIREKAVLDLAKERGWDV